MTARRHKLWINGQWAQSEHGKLAEIHSPYSGEGVAQADQASPAQVEQALAAAHEAFGKFRKISRYGRSRLLALMAQEIGARRAEFVELIVSEAGKPYGLADGEVGRAINTFTIASEEAKRMGGEVIPIDIEPAGRAYAPATTFWVPGGPILAIAPFNFPLNLIAHKVAPALAVGASIVVKPPPQAPGAATLLAEVFEKAAREASDSRDQIPLAALQVISGSNEVIGPTVTDPRMTFLSFTGSDKVGWVLREKAYRKKVALELGGNAAVIVHSDADIQRAAARCAFGGFAYAGQICISVQRIIVQQSVAAKFQELLLAEVSKLVVGNPAQKDTVVGPLIDSKAADRVMSWIDEARQDGAKVLVGGTRNGSVIAPTILTGVKPHHKLNTEEVFGPVVVLNTYDGIDEAVASVNRSRFGLQAGVFTDSSKVIRKVIEELEVGGVMINEVPTYRADNMPYGGVKDSGVGREGIRYAMEEYCERRTVVAWQG